MDCFYYTVRVLFQTLYLKNLIFNSKPALILYLFDKWYLFSVFLSFYFIVKYTSYILNSFKILSV